MSPRIIGKPGIGKTTLAYAVARNYSENVYILQCTVDTRPEDLLVTPVIGEQQHIRYHASPLVTAMLKGGICILDEGNRMGEKSWASLAPLLDTRRYVESIIAGIKIPAHPDFRLAVTMNDDASTFDVPDYIQSRLQPQIEVGFPPAEEELEILQVNLPEAPEEILKWVSEFLQQGHQAKKPYSTRDGVNIARYAIKHLHLNQGTTLGAVEQALLQILGEEAHDLFLSTCVHKPKSEKPNILLLGSQPPAEKKSPKMEVELELEDFEEPGIDFTLDDQLAEALRAQGFEVEFIELQSLSDFMDDDEAEDLEDEAGDDRLPDLRSTDIPDTLNISQWEHLRRSPQEPHDDADHEEEDDSDAQEPS